MHLQAKSVAPSPLSRAERIERAAAQSTQGTLSRITQPNNHSGPSAAPPGWTLYVSTDRPTLLRSALSLSLSLLHSAAQRFVSATVFPLAPSLWHSSLQFLPPLGPKFKPPLRPQQSTSQAAPKCARALPILSIQFPSHQQRQKAQLLHPPHLSSPFPKGICYRH